MLQADLWFLSSNIQMGLGPLLSCTHSKYHAYGRFTRRLIVSLVHERWLHTPSVTNGNEYVVVSDKPGYLYIFLLDYALPLWLTELKCFWTFVEWWCGTPSVGFSKETSGNNIAQHKRRLLRYQAFVDGSICSSLFVTVERARLSVYFCKDLDAQLCPIEMYDTI